ncbi:hypothetical protein INT48_007512 [Thamnidium elegans]|uniref:BZIP domain-containing protein n=1 Tax=Thamnidium elegans TaxID=101142 RepID=A0A8H7SGD8_9FUNG|nr:hypothetical protein INT48_007512 [Thamnidium elegans]
MTTSTRRNYAESIGSEDSLDWSSDSAPKPKRRTSRTIEGPIKKSKKPGRKPLAKVTVLPSDPKLKRKAQNRAAQRAFRERKEQFVSELQEQMRQMKQATDKREKQLSLENQRLKKENQKLKQENYILKDAKFTFEFPSSSTTKISDKSQPTSPYSQLSMGSSLSGEEDNLALPETYMDASPMMTAFEDLAPDNMFYTKPNNNTSDYRTNDFLNQSEPLPQLFGNEMDLFGVDSPSSFHSSTQLDPIFSEQMKSVINEENLLKCAPENEKPCRKKIIAILDRAKGTNRRMFEIHQDVKSYCPDVNLDQLCLDLKKKIAFDFNHILSDADVDLYIQCIQRNS